MLLPETGTWCEYSGGSPYIGQRLVWLEHPNEGCARNDEGRGLPRPSRREGNRLLAGAGDDVAGRSDLVVGDGAGEGVLDAVGGRVRALDLDVLDALVVRSLKNRERDALVPGGMVGVERLHAGNGRAHVGLRCGDVRAQTEAEVRRDGDREQD